MALARCLILPGAIVVIAAIASVNNLISHNSLAGTLDPETRTVAVPSRYEPERLALDTTRKLSEVETSYLDTFHILREDNSCSRFFGGPEAIQALSQLTQQLRPAHLDRHIGIRMRGDTTSVLNYSTGFRYRLFGTVEVNINGPFFQGNGLPGRSRISSIGSFLPNTREARATLLLHELGHLIRKSDGQWVLRDDGNDSGLSSENTHRVIEACGKQIRELHKFSFEEELQAQLKTPDRSVLGESPVG
jgi:hypothetical protein